MEIYVAESPEQAAVFTGSWMARQLRESVARGGHATLALSGGSTAPRLLASLIDQQVPWSSVSVWQVDERVAPDGDPDRNANHLGVLPGDATVHLMPVTDDDLDRAADQYASGLPQPFDLVHLGVGPDGHTASWPPGDPVAGSRRLVDLSGEYQGRIRMTLTPGVVNAARCRLVYVLGADRAEVMARWLRGDDSLPIGLVDTEHTMVVLDVAAASSLPQ